MLWLFKISVFYLYIFYVIYFCDQSWCLHHSNILIFCSRNIWQPYRTLWKQNDTWLFCAFVGGGRDSSRAGEVGEGAKSSHPRVEKNKQWGQLTVCTVTDDISLWSRFSSILCLLKWTLTPLINSSFLSSLPVTGPFSTLL